MTVHDGPQEISYALVNMYAQRVQRHGPGNGKTYDIKFNGYPWRPSGEETVTTRVLLLELLGCLESFGFSLYASIDQNNPPSGDNAGSAADVLVFSRESNWVPGAPVFHR